MGARPAGQPCSATTSPAHDNPNSNRPDAMKLRTIMVDPLKLWIYREPYTSA